MRYFKVSKDELYIMEECICIARHRDVLSTNVSNINIIAALVEEKSLEVHQYKICFIYRK